MSLQTPWGVAQQTKNFCRGFGQVYTAGHGGLRVTDKVLREKAGNPDLIMRLGGMAYGNYIYFEEDCAYALLLVDAPELCAPFAASRGLDANEVFKQCYEIAQRWYPEYFTSEV